MGDADTIIRNKWVIRSSNSNSNSSSSKWSEHVPDDIMQSILHRLCILHYVRCGSVCRSWRDSVVRARCRPAPELPWLFSPSRRTFLRYNSEQKIYKLNLPTDDEYDAYVGSIEGWLMRVDWTGSIITLLNPISGGRVMLPRCKHEVTAPFIRKVVASSVPTTRSPSCTVVACLSTGVENTTLAVCRPTDKSWTRIDEGLSFEDIQFIDEKLYAATKNPSKFLIVFQFDTNNHDHHQQIQYRAKRLVVLDDPGPDRERFEHIFTIKKSGLFLATDLSTSKELLMITFPDNYIEELLVFPPNYADAFQVFKLEFNNNAAANNVSPPPPPRWVEIVGFRDRILFLCQRCNEFNDATYADTNDLHDIYLRHCIISGLGLFSLRTFWFTPNPW
ncbi:hypothetical protein CerSpe_267470 [Prunus speciosa]